MIVTSNGSLDRNGTHQWVGVQCYDNNYVIVEDRLKLLAILSLLGKGQFGGNFGYTKFK